MMTFDPQDVKLALTKLKLAQKFAGNYKVADQGWSLFKKEGDHLLSLNLVQKHAELIYHESTLLRSLLVLITQKNVLAFVKHGLTIRSSYNGIKACYKGLQRIHDQNNGPQGFVKRGFDEHYLTGIIILCFLVFLSHP